MASMYHICVAAFALICLGKTHQDVNMESAPNVTRAGDLLSSIMLYTTYTSSMNYDSYFFSPALRALATNRIQEDHKGSYDTFISFLVNDFKMENHASNFSFSDTETRDQFLSRFFQYLKSSSNTPENVKLAIGDLEQYIEDESDDARGFIKPCPIYIILRTLTFITELDYTLSDIRDQHLSSVDTIIGFLIRDFEPSVHGEGLNLNEGEVVDIEFAAMFGFTQAGNIHPFILSDGVLATTRNKQFFLHIFPTVPYNVKTAITVVLPYL